MNDLIKRLRHEPVRYNGAVKIVNRRTPLEIEAANRLTAMKAAGDGLAGLLDEVQRQGCEVCSGDCAAAMPPVGYCPPKMRASALKQWKEASDGL